MTFPEQIEGFAVHSKAEWNKPKRTSYAPKPFDDNDIDIEIECCGVCGSDCHTVKSNWGTPHYPLVVGHEIIGKVIRVGPKCDTGVKVGDRVGVGAQALSCLECSRCKSNNEMYCSNSVTTYDGVYSKHNYVSQGGYASHIRVHEHFAFQIPDEIESIYAAPLMCAGLTVFSPLYRNNVKKGTTVGIVGIGGLGHLAIMFAKAFGAEVYAISRTRSKEADAKKMGVDGFIATNEDGWSNNHHDRFDFLLNCASSLSDLDINAFVATLKIHAKFVSVGLPSADETFTVSPATLLRNGSFIGSSALGSRAEALEMLKLAAKTGIKPWVETLQISEESCSEALTRCDKSDVKYRFTLTGFDKAFKN